MDLDAVEVRVLGCLLEKQRTTPDAYPLSLNALRAACNQATNRDPVVGYDEATIRDALNRLYRRRWTRLASGAGSRTAKYRHLLDDALGLAPDESAVLAVLMLRGAQTPGELNQRTDRLHPFAGLDVVQATLQRLADRGLAASIGRRAGQKEERYVHLLSEDADSDGAPTAAVAVPRPADTTPLSPPPAPVPPSAPDETPSVPSVEHRVARLEADVAGLQAELRDLARRLER